MIAFDIDKQTLNDLEIFSSSDSQKSLFSLFNRTCTIEGSSTLKLIFKNPLTDIKLISERKNLIEFLQKLSWISLRIGKLLILLNFI